jgi:pimeloyl-ACP methyl ester carboxylesterase
MIDRLIFGRPRRKRDLTPGPYCDFSINPVLLERPGGVVLHGWMAAPAVAPVREKVIIYFGGRMEDTWWAPRMASYLDGWTIYAFNYRGFGDSRGSASEKNAKADALAIYEFVKSRHAQGNTDVALMGRSLGTAIAIWLAHKIKPARLILVSPFCSMRSVLRGKFWLAPLSVLARKRFRNANLVSEISARTLIILAEKDREISHADSLKLANTFCEQPLVVKVGGTNHKTVPRNQDTQRLVARFLMDAS